MDFNVTLGIGGWTLVVVGAIVLGIVLQLVGEVQFGYEWIVTAVGAGVGAIVCSEFVIDWRTFQPVWDDLALIPAIVGGLVVGVILAVVVRYGMGGSFLRTSEA